MKFDFSGWATRNDLLCSDGRTIRKGAFKGNDGETVPLVWDHQSHDKDNILGHALLENRDEGVYAYCTFNDTDSGTLSKKLVKHGDIRSLSILANRLKHMGNDVVSGVIREVSLVPAGANPGAFIDEIVAHGDDSEPGMIVGYDENILIHGEEFEEDTDLAHADSEDNLKEESDESDETIEDIVNSMNEKQQNALYFLVGQALEGDDSEDDDDEDETGKEDTMKHNIFEKDYSNDRSVLSHADQSEILKLAKSSSVGSLKEAMNIYMEENQLQHADVSGFVQTGTPYNITTMFPEYTEAHPSRTPELITNDMGWVDAIMSKTQKVPHGRVRTSSIDIRNIDSLKAKGHKKGQKKAITGNYNLVRRTTDPQTVYVSSELYRDDVLDIEDFDYVAFQYGVDQISLKETLAVATMLGDDRDESDPAKIFPDKIRPIWTDDELYTIHKDIDFGAMATELQGKNGESFGTNFIYAEAMVNALRMARKDYRGTGKPDLFITTDMLNTMILARDFNGRRIYGTVTELAAALGVGNIYEVSQFEDRERTDANGTKHKLLAICVNMADYAYGASKGGDITHFTDFDLKFNTLQSLLETRKSGQLTRIKSAIVIEEVVSNEV